MRFAFVCALCLAADLTAGVQVQNGVRLGGPLGDSTELALIAQLKALIPDSSIRASMDKSFASASIVGMELPNPAAQAIADRIFGRRKAHADSVAATWPKSPELPLILNATVVLVDSLSDPLASAEIRRRADMEPHEVILLRADHATLGAIGAAIQALSDLWVGDGLLPVPSSNVNFMVQGEKLMKSWSPLQQDMMMSQLTTAAKTPIAGIGEVRSFTIAVAHRRPPVAKP